MRKFALALSLATCLSGCVTETQYGDCKGLATKDEEDPNLIYKVKTWNVVAAVIFSPSLIWPALTGAFWLYCPEGKKAAK